MYLIVGGKSIIVLC